MRNILGAWIVTFLVLAALTWVTGIHVEVMMKFISAGLGVGLLGGMSMYIAKRAGVKVDGNPRRLIAWILPVVAALVFAWLIF